MGRKKGRTRDVRYSLEFKLKVVRTALERKLKNDEVVQLFGIGSSTWAYWKKAYKDGGEPARMKKAADGRMGT